MNIRRAFTFAWRMALAYLRVALSLTLILAVGLALLLMIFLILMGFVNWNVGDIFGLASVAGRIAQRLVSLLSVGFVLNIVGVAYWMVMMPQALDMQYLRTSFAYLLLCFNLLGMPILVATITQMFGSEPTLIFLFFIVITCVIALYSWKKVVDWYELSEQGIKKKKNIPTIEKPKIETTQTDAADMVVAEDDTARVRKSR